MRNACICKYERSDKKPTFISLVYADVISCLSVFTCGMPGIKEEEV